MCLTEASGAKPKVRHAPYQLKRGNSYQKLDPEKLATETSHNQNMELSQGGLQQVSPSEEPKPVARSRATTWSGQRPAFKKPSQEVTCQDDSTRVATYQSIVNLSTLYDDYDLIPAPRNPWGDQSYGDLIGAAIRSVPERRMTLSQIYDWLIEHVPYFGERADKQASAGWKNSVRHNLSLHKKFLRLNNEVPGMPSWWVINPIRRQPNNGARQVVVVPQTLAGSKNNCETNNLAKTGSQQIKVEKTSDDENKQTANSENSLVNSTMSPRFGDMQWQQQQQQVKMEMQSPTFNCSSSFGAAAPSDAVAESIESAFGDCMLTDDEIKASLSVMFPELNIDETSSSNSSCSGDIKSNETIDEIWSSFSLSTNQMAKSSVQSTQSAQTMLSNESRAVIGWIPVNQTSEQPMAATESAANAENSSYRSYVEMCAALGRPAICCDFCKALVLPRD